MKLIPLTKGYEAMVDDEDYDNVSKYNWYAHVLTHTCYAARQTGGRYNRTTVFLHNFLIVPFEGFRVDHIDRNGLNCQRVNLRLATNSQNQYNRIVTTSRYKYKGIRLKPSGNWEAFIRADCKYIYLGTFNTAELAAIAYDEAVKKYHGEYGRINNANRS